MIHFAVKPLCHSDWTHVHEAEVRAGVTILCKAALGIDLPPVKAGRPYFYTGEFLDNENDQDRLVFSVIEVSEIND